MVSNSLGFQLLFPQLSKSTKSLKMKVWLYNASQTTVTPESPGGLAEHT